MRTRLTLLQWSLKTRLERLQIFIAWHLPRWLVYWATIRCFAHGTTGRYGTTEPDSLTYGTLMRRWTDPKDCGRQSR